MPPANAPFNVMVKVALPSASLTETSSIVISELSLSLIVTVSVAVPIVPLLTDEIVATTVSSPSVIRSSMTSTVTNAVVAPAGITTEVVPSAPVKL